LTEKASPDKDKEGKTHDSGSIRRRSFFISILVFSVIINSLISSSIFSSSLFTISSTHAQQTPPPPRQNPQERQDEANQRAQQTQAEANQRMQERQAQADQRTQCTSPKRLCGNNCVDTQTDINNCGSCDNPCDPINEKCQGGFCVNKCGLGQTVCDGICIDTSKDPLNCGSCDSPCNEDQFCDGGACKSQCGPGETFCSNDPIVKCRNLQTDDTSCGACGRNCETMFAADSTCVTGRCQCPQGQEVSNGKCVPTCSADMVRNPSGVCECRDPTKVNVNGQCQCVAGRTDCHTAESSCKDLSSDAGYCGACNIKCASGMSCVNGKCEAPCPEGQIRKPDGTCGCPDGQHFSTTFGKCVPICEGNQVNVPPNGNCGCDLGPGTFPEKCGSMCVDTAHDENNCGGCANADGDICGAGEICNNGSCTCALGQTMCNGQCINTQTSKQNCGACGTSCNTDETCAQGKCTKPNTNECPLGQNFDPGTNSCKSKCTSNEFYNTVIGNCEQRTCDSDPNATVCSTSGNCVCNSGFEHIANQNGCVPKCGDTHYRYADGGCCAFTASCQGPTGPPYTCAPPCPGPPASSPQNSC